MSQYKFSYGYVFVQNFAWTRFVISRVDDETTQSWQARKDSWKIRSVDSIAIAQPPNRGTGRKHEVGGGDD